MLKSLRTAEQAMNMRLTQIDTLANNLANVDAGGFKQVLTRIAEEGTGSAAAEPLAGLNPAEVMNPAGQAASTGAGEEAGAVGAETALATGSAAARASRGGGGVKSATRPVSLALGMTAAVDTRPGPLRETGRMADVSVQGRGFFVIQTPRGQMYTRNGHFSVDQSGRLVTSGGSPVLGTGGPLEVEGGSFTVGRDGSVMVGDSLVGRLQVVDFSDPSRLEHRGDSLLAAPRDMAAEAMGPDVVEVVQGQLEGSNVDPILTMVAMIAAQRAFEIESRLMQAGDENLEKAVNQLPQVR